MTAWNVVLAERASLQALAIDAWWRANREAAPDLFEMELARVMGRLASAPRSAPSVRGVPGDDELRCAVLLRTGYQAFYRVREDAGLVGTYPAAAKAGGGYVWDDVLEYRVWC